GTAGIQNLVKTHEGKGSCIAAKAKLDKVRGQRKNGSMMHFFSKAAKPQHVPSTVQAPATVNPRLSTPQSNPAKITQKKAAAPALSQTLTYSRPIQLLNQLRVNVALLPSTIVNADQTNPLSVFSGDPATYISAVTKAEELWEALSHLFHKAFGYGEGLDTRVSMVQRGSLGLDGFLNFLEYFISDRGLEGGMLELKIKQMIEAVQSVYVDQYPVCGS
ncbi:hypothetical protein B0H13DRAFT_1636074, partial [Mycena leptocephala]